MKFDDITGQRFGALVPLQYEWDGGLRKTRWLCRCDCGTEKWVTKDNLRSGGTISCGCVRLKATRERSRIHGMARTRPYRVWAAMIYRCSNEACKDFRHYGGRGIAVCEEWRDFQKFWEDMRIGYQPGLEIDRIDNDGNYEPKNCRWATRSQQMKNCRLKWSHRHRNTLGQFQ